MMLTGAKIKSDEIESFDKRVPSHWKPGLMVSDFERVKQLRAFIEKTEEEISMLKSNKSSLGEYINHLKKESLKTRKGGDVDLLFNDPLETGDYPCSQRKAYRLAERVCKRANLRVRHPHDLQHTYATTLLMAHWRPDYVRRQLGHSSISITVDAYGHWIPGRGRDGLEEALLGEVVGAKSERKCTPNAHGQKI